MPPLPRHRITAARALALVASALTLACTDSPTGPAKDRFLLALGDSVEASVALNDSAGYRMVLSAGQSFAVHLWGIDQPFTATVVDSLNWVYAISRSSTVGGSFAQWNPVTAPHGGTYRIVVRPAIGSTGGKFALRAAAVETAPEQVPATFQLGDTVTGESLDGRDDIDDFTVDLAAGQRLEIFFQTLASSSDQPTAELYAEQGGVPLAGPMAQATTARSTEDLESQGSGVIYVASAGRYHLRVRNLAVTTRGAYTGPYRFALYPIDPAPERAPAAITPGDTIVESIDHVGDLDVFTLTATPGKQFNLFAEAGGAAPHQISAMVFAADSLAVGAHANISATPGGRLLDQASGWFTMPATGTMIVVVRDWNTASGLYRGPYRLLVYPIDSLPEGRSPDFVPSATPIAGTIDQLGDVDAYHFVLTTTQELTLLGYPTPSLVQFALVGDATGSIYQSAVPPGSYHVRVYPKGSGQTGDYRGPYQFVVSPTLAPPENVPATLAPGDSISAETIAWPRDLDTLTLAAASPDTVVLELSRPAGDTSWNQSIWVNDPATDSIVSRPSIWDGDRYEVPRLDLVPGKPLRVSVYGYTSNWAPGSAGAYQLVAKRVSAAPEHRSPIIGIGDTVRDSLDYYGDIDDYVVSGAPGTELDVQGSWPSSQAPPTLIVSLIDPATDSILAVSSSLTGAFSPVTRIPAGGQLRVRTCVGDTSCAVPRCDGWDCVNGSYPLLHYWLVVHAVDRAPETIPPTFAFGDTVSGESIDWIYDIDEFTFAGAAGQKVDVAFQWMETIAPPGTAPGLQLELVDATTGSVLATLVANGSAPSLDDVASGPVVLPSTGSYILRARGTPDTSGYGLWSSGPFRFRVTNVP